MAIDDALKVQILRLHFVEHWRVATIASQLGVHHYTVERVLGEAGGERERRRPPLLLPRPGGLGPLTPFGPGQRHRRLLPLRFARHRIVVLPADAAASAQAFRAHRTKPIPYCSFHRCQRAPSRNLSS